MGKPSAEFMCRFCGQTIQPCQPDPLTLLITLSPGEPQQQIFAHRACLRRVIHSTIPLFVDALYDDETE